MKEIKTSIVPTKIICRYLCFCQMVNPACKIVSTFNTKCHVYQVTIFGADQVSVLQYSPKWHTICYSKQVSVTRDFYLKSIPKPLMRAMKLSDVYSVHNGYVTNEKAIVYVPPVK